MDWGLSSPDLPLPSLHHCARTQELSWGNSFSERTTTVSTLHTHLVLRSHGVIRWNLKPLIREGMDAGHSCCWDRHGTVEAEANLLLSSHFHAPNSTHHYCNQSILPSRCRWSRACHVNADDGSACMGPWKACSDALFAMVKMHAKTFSFAS